MLPRLFFVAVVLIALKPLAESAERPFARSVLLGVWEVVACESLAPRQADSSAATPNFKYCFSDREAYPDLAADAVSDSADGGGEYYLVGGDILVIRTGVPTGGLYAFQLASVGPEQIVWHRNGLSFTLRRIAKNWDGRHVPKRRPRSVPISYPS